MTLPIGAPAAKVWQWSAGEIVARLTSRQVSAVEVLTAFLDRVSETNSELNAICTLVQAEAILAAQASDKRLRGGYPARPLEGVPFTVKDVIPVKGVRTTYGSEIYKDFVGHEDAVSVERIRKVGAVLLGKTNTPEFAHGPFFNTTNSVFGLTRNPWDVNRTAGASSGGAAVAIASGMAPIAIGTDWGGSTRGPAALCGVVGLRPSPGLVPVYPHESRSGFAWDFPVEHVHGPMARSVHDVGVMLQALAGPDDRAPASLPKQQHDYELAASGQVDLSKRRVAFSTDLGGLLPVESDVADAVRSAGATFEKLGCEVVESSPDFSSLKEIVSGIRDFGMVLRYTAHLHQRDLMSASLNRQVDAALQISVTKVADVERMRTALWHHVRLFMEQFDYIVTPTLGVCAYRIDTPLVRAIDDRPADNFFDATLFTWAMSVLGLPAISVPGGFNRAGLPVGIQIAGRRLSDHAVLEAASAYEIARGPIAWPPPLGEQRLHPMDPSFDGRNWSLPFAISSSARD